MSTLKANRYENTASSDGGIDIDSSGKLGFGTASPKEVVDSRGAAVFSGDHATAQNAYGTAHGIMLSSTSNLASVKAVSNGSNDVAIRFIPLSSGSGSEAMRIRSSGEVEVHEGVLWQYNTGSTDSRSWHVRNDIHAYGDLAFRRSTTQTGATYETKILFKDTGGICFNGDTAAANALDDYEEGNFTPTYSSGLTSPSYTGTSGNYTKIGNLVTVTIRIRATGTNAASHLQIAGLPFTSGGSMQEGSFSFGYADNISGASGSPVMHVPTNGTSMQFYNQDGSNWDGNSGNGISGRTLHIRGFYFV